jgi:hypothetical protein
MLAQVQVPKPQRVQAHAAVILTMIITQSKLPMNTEDVKRLRVAADNGCFDRTAMLTAEIDSAVLELAIGYNVNT